MRVVSLFSGAGGLDLGFVQAGHSIVWANDDYKDAVDTYKLNIGDHIVFGDIRTISSSDIPHCDIIIGGFPCQGFSVANTKRNEGDSRNLLYLEFLRILKEKKPSYFLAENVKGLASMSNGRILQMILRDFEDVGYVVQHDVLNAADYGVPQNRHRVIIIGRTPNSPPVSFPEPTHASPDVATDSQKQPWTSVGQALEHIPEPSEAPEMPNHTCSKYKLRFNGYLGHRRVDPLRPAPTVTGRGDSRGGVVVLHHPSNSRRMSARELATVQSFPSDFIFSGCRSSAYRQIANAVPTLMARRLAEVFPARLRRAKKVGY